MLFASGISDRKTLSLATEALLKQILASLEGSACDLAVLFVSPLYDSPWEPMVQKIRQKLGNPLLIGCTGGGILGADKELEFMPALSLAAAHLPEVRLHPFKILPEDLNEEQDPSFWVEKLGANPTQEPVGILLPEPFSCNVMNLVQTFNKIYPKMPLIGGLASGTGDAKDHALFLNDQIVSEGAVGVLLTGNITLQTIVSQGCRPIGRPFIITKAEGNLILELASQPATEALQQLFESLSDSDKALAQQALLIGIVMNEQKENFKRGDFLIRNLIGIDPSQGAIAVGDKVQVGQTVQFQLRDADTAREDLQQLLKDEAPRFKKAPSKGALLFSCMGRGKDLYGQRHYDIRTIQAALGNCPMAGFFCNGEIGPIGGRNYIHGFTSSLGLFRPKETA